MNKKNNIITSNQSAFRNKDWKFDSIFNFVLSRKSKFIKQNQKLKIDFNFQFCIWNTKLQIDCAEWEQKPTQ